MELIVIIAIIVILLAINANSKQGESSHRDVSSYQSPKNNRWPTSSSPSSWNTSFDSSFKEATPSTTLPTRRCRSFKPKIRKASDWFEIRGVDKGVHPRGSSYWKKEHRLYLKRERCNQNDPNAIQVLDENGNFTAYVERDKAVTLAPILDSSNVVMTIVNIPNTYSREMWGRCYVKIEKGQRC